MTTYIGEGKLGRAVALLALLFSGCSVDEERGPAAQAQAASPRDIDELQRIAHTPRPCEVDAQCPSGSHCDGQRWCAWECLADSDCGDDKLVCTRLGTCEGRVGPTILSPADSPACQAVPFEERRAVLESLDQDQRFCAGDEDCPCGAYCASDAVCRAECMAEQPDHPELFCDPGSACTPLGRCIESGEPPAPSIEVTVEIDPAVLAADSTAGPVLVQAQVVLVANSVDVLDPTHPAQVFVGFAERSDPESATMPQVKCAASAPLAESCELDGGWVFNVSSGSLRSDPRPVWVQLPQRSSAEQWTLEARSEWSDLPAIAVVRAAPLSFPTSSAGTYSGALTWPQADGTSLTLDVSAIVTDTHVALFEDTRVLLPHGHAVLPRDPSLATRLSWLTSDAPGSPDLSILMDLGALAYQSGTGKLTATITTRGVPLALDVSRDGEISSPTCSSQNPCPSGSYCSATNLCLLGARPPHDIVSDGASTNEDLASKQLVDWWAKFAPLADQDTRFRGRDVTGIERAYCNRTPSASGPASFGHNTVGPSGDLVCRDGAAPATFPQATFPFANRVTEVVEDANGLETFNLLEQCLTDLAVQPPAGSSAGELLPTGRQCVSLGRFFLVLRANRVNNFLSETARRVLSHIMRQWLALNAYVARTTLQEQDYDDVLDSGGPPSSERFGAAVDLMEQAWRVWYALRHQSISGQEIDKTEYRLVNRPVLHWSFNDPITSVEQDSENDFDLNVSGSFSVSEDRLIVTGATSAQCISQDPIALPDHSFTLMGYVGAKVPGRYTLFQKFNLVDPFRVEIEWSPANPNPALATVHVTTPTSAVKFFVDLQDGYFALVVEANSIRLYRLSAPFSQFADIPIRGGTPTWGQPGFVHLGCMMPGGGSQAPLVSFDEVSLWPRAFSREELVSMSELYLEGGVPEFDEVGVPARGPGGIVVSPRDEQATGLAAHILDAASAHADLLAAYVEAERSAMYDACYLGAPSPAREAVLGRVGRALRLIYLAEKRAAELVPTHAPPAWMARYQASRTDLAGKRRKVVDALRSLEECSNPLGITEEDLPLYHGEAVGSSERFFASSRYLAGRARSEIDDAQDDLDAARNAYHQQRLSQFQVTMSAIEKNERLRKLKLEYEAALRRLCGPRADGQPLLPGFVSGALTASNCLFKTELSGCQNLESRSIKRVPPQCLRGELGEQILAIQAAGIDVENAQLSYNRALDQYAAGGEYCARRQAHHEESDQILTDHLEHVRRLRAERRAAAMMGGFFKNMAGMLIGTAVGSPETAVGSWLDSVGMVLGQPAANLEEAEQRANEQYQQVVQRRSQELDLLACYHEVDNQKFAIDAARDIIKRADQEVTAALLRLRNHRDELTALAAEAVGQIATEDALDRTPPHHHYWLADQIDTYKRHLRHARRLTYLALRSFEYESQQSLGARGRVLTARHPAELEDVIDDIENRNAPMQGEQGFSIGERAVVLSLRDEILRLEDLVGNGSRAPGDPPLTAEEVLRIILRSGSAQIFDRDAEYVGQGIRFELMPAGWSETSCAERTWRVTASVQMTNPVNNAVLVLNQENAFASQECHAETRGELHVARIRPHHNLLVGETAPNFTSPSQYTSMNVEANMNVSRGDLEDLAEGQHGGFAGRGVYGNYLLLFPAGTFTDSVLANVKDVLLRFDFVEATNADL
jgi:hypothetical protein